jgi:hypothetical protein
VPEGSPSLWVDHLSIAVREIAPVLKTTLRGERQTAFLHPHDSHDMLLQFRQEPDFGGPRRA